MSLSYAYFQNKDVIPSEWGRKEGLAFVGMSLSLYWNRHFSGVLNGHMYVREASLFLQALISTLLERYYGHSYPKFGERVRARKSTRLFAEVDQSSGYTAILIACL